MKKLLACLLVLSSQLAFGAVGFDTFTDVGSGSGTSLSNTVTCNGPNPFLLVCVDQAISIVSGITYNGVNVPLQTSQGRAFAYGQNNPSTGSNTLAVTAGGGTTFRVIAACYTGVSSSGQPEATGTTTGTLAGGANIPFNATVTTLTNNAWIVGCWDINGGTFAANGTGVYRGNQASGNVSIGDSNAPITPAGTTNVSLQESFSGGATAATAAFSIAPLGASGGGSAQDGLTITGGKIRISDKTVIQ